MAIGERELTELIAERDEIEQKLSNSTKQVWWWSGEAVKLFDQGKTSDAISKSAVAETILETMQPWRLRYHEVSTVIDRHT